jgi:hypothetical protein
VFVYQAAIRLPAAANVREQRLFQRLGRIGCGLQNGDQPDAAMQKAPATLLALFG